MSVFLCSDLLKLVHPEDAAGVPAVGAHFLSEAGGEAGVADREFLRFQPLIPQEGCDRLLGGGDEVLLIDGVIVRLLTALTDDLKNNQRLRTGQKPGGWTCMTVEETLVTYQHELNYK